MSLSGNAPRLPAHNREPPYLSTVTNMLGLLKPFGRRASVEDFGLYLLPQEFIPRNATFVDQRRGGVVPPGIPGLPGTLLAFEYLVPSNRRGVMRRLGVDAEDPAALASLSVSVLRSGAPVPNYQLVTLPIGSPDTPDLVYVEFDRDQLLQIVVSNTSLVSPYDTSARVVAWFWDVSEESGR